MKSEPNKDDLADTVSHTYQNLRSVNQSVQYLSEQIYDLSNVVLTLAAFCVLLLLIMVYRGNK